MAGFICNPGAGPINGRTQLREALKNMTALKRDAKLPRQRTRRRRSLDGDGRYGFWIRNNAGKVTTIAMPGIPLQHVRWRGHAHEDAWLFPRLYVDGSSWLWRFAVELLAEGESL